MNRERAKQNVVVEWDSWSASNKITNAMAEDKLTFYAHLLKERPDLLDFNASGDKWQDVHSWLIRSRRVSVTSGDAPY
jgi:hypothetical protein